MPVNRKNTGARKPASKPQVKRASGTRRPAAKKTSQRSVQSARRQVKSQAARVNKKVTARTQSNANTDTPMMLYFCIGFLLLVFTILDWTNGTNPITSWIADLLHGLTGSLILPLPVVLFWMGVRRFRGEEKQGCKGTDELPPLATFVLILTVWEAFYAQSIFARMEVTDSYANFIQYAYNAKSGGGAIGAVLGYWGSKLTPWLTALIAVMLELILFNRRGYFSVKGISEGVQKGTLSVKQHMGAIKTAIDEKRELYSENRHAENFDDIDDVDIPDFDRQIRVKQEELKSAGRQMHIDTAGEQVKPEKPYRGETKAPRRADESVYTERVQKPEKPEQPARKHEPKPEPKAEQVKPVRRHEPQPEPEYEEPDTMDEAPDINDETGDDYETPEFVERPHKEPQQPKPSFFDDGVKGRPTITQKTEQGQSVKQARADVKPGATIEQLDRDNPEAGEPYRFPDFELLETGAHNRTENSSDIDAQRGQMLVDILSDFNIPVKLVGVSHGPAVTRLEILPDPGIKVSRITQYSDDIQMGLEVKSVRIEAPIPGRRAVGVEIPNAKREIVNLRDVLESPEARTSKKKLLVALGKDNSGSYVLADLAGMPHVLIAGQTGSGKSICINAIIISLLYRYTPDEVRMIMVDPKMVELNVYNTIPHLLIPVVTDPQKAAGALDWAVMEMTRRYKVFKDAGTKNIENYNQHLQPGEKPMPRIVIIIDELADLMMVAKHDVEDSINRLAQLARAAGMHLVIATQRPSVNVITGLIKANIPTRIAFAVASGTDSTCILDCYGAEKLLGKGDMLYAPADSNKPTRMQGAWVSEDEVERVVDHIASQQTAEFDEEILDHLDKAASTDADRKDKQDAEAAEDTDPLLAEAVRAVVEAGQASISMLQRKLKVGYPRAGKLIDMMEQRGFVSKGEGSKAREVIITREELDRLFGSGAGEDSDEA